MSPRSVLLLGLAIAVLAANSSRGDGEEGDGAKTPIVATHYFYWYRWPDKHFNQPGAPGPEGHFHHLPHPEKVSYESQAWHVSQLAAMKKAGIDVALPVYWGAPGAYEREKIRFSRDGLKPMVAAARQLGDRSVKLGLFYDTSTLRAGVRGEKTRRPGRGPDHPRGAGPVLPHGDRVLRGDTAGAVGPRGGPPPCRTLHRGVRLEVGQGPGNRPPEPLRRAVRRRRAAAGGRRELGATSGRT